MILIGKKAIMAAMGIHNQGQFKRFFKAGLPVKVIDRIYYADSENLKDWCKTYFKREPG